MRLWLVMGFLAACLGQVRADLGEPGTFAAGYRQVSVTRANGSTFTARLFYPALVAGENAAIDGSGGPYPGISFGHGFVQAVSNYQSTLLHLASHGYLVIATNSEGGLFPSHANFAADLLLSLTYLEQQNTLPGGFLEGLVDTAAFGLSGHSMGGGASILAASDPRVRAIAPLAAANTNPSSIAASSTFFVPVRHIVGSSDTIVTPATTIQMYNNSARARQFVNLQGGFHCGFIDSQGFGCDTGSMTRGDQLRFTRRLLTEFFNLYLKGDQNAWRAVWFDEAQSDPRIVTTGEADSEISPAEANLSVRAGATVTIPIDVFNRGPDVMTLTLEVVESPWPVAFEPAGVGPLAINASGKAVVRVVLPPEATLGQSTVIVAARSGRDGGSRSIARLALTVTCGGDFNGDKVVDFFDVQAFLAAFSDDDSSADFNGDGIFDFFDVQAFLASFSAGCG